MAEVVSKQRKAALSRKQSKFIDEYVANNGNGTAAARAAGYRDGIAIRQQAHENLTKPDIVAEIERRTPVIVTPERVQERLHDISLDAQAAGQFGPAVRAEELLGKSIGMWIDQQLSVVVGDTAVAAMIELARRRQAEPVDLVDDHSPHERPHQLDDDGA